MQGADFLFDFVMIDTIGYELNTDTFNRHLVPIDIYVSSSLYEQVHLLC